MNPPKMGERGNASIEVAMGVPAIVLFLALVILGGRLALAQQAVQAAAADAARTASIARTPTDARTHAQQAANQTLANQGVHCTATTINIDTSQLTRTPGTPANVTATIGCRITATDLGLPGPASFDVKAHQTSSIDTYRGR